MRLFALDGQGGAALAQYDACCGSLKKELGILPSEKIRNLAERIRKDKLRAGGIDAKGESPMPFLPPLAAERRQVTVLYCELTLPGIEEPGKMIALLQAPLKRCTKTIRHFSGHIARSHDGGLLAYFGYPEADENAARKAVQAALACVRETTPELAVRAGVHTGLIIAGSGLGVPDTIGLTSSIAIRLRLEVGGGEAALSADTHRLAGKYFKCRSLGEKQLRDTPHSLEVFEVKGERADKKRASKLRMDEQFGIFFTDGDRIARRIAEDISPRVTADQSYQKAKKNTAKTARTALDAALMRAAGSLLKDDTEFYKQLVQNESFRQFVAGMVIKPGNT